MLLPPAERVFLLQHLHIHSNGEEDTKVIGIYRTREAAQKAIERLRSKPGFKDFPQTVDYDSNSDQQGFHLDEMQLDHDSWSEGYTTEPSI